MMELPFIFIRNLTRFWFVDIFNHWNNDVLSSMVEMVLLTDYILTFNSHSYNKTFQRNCDNRVTIDLALHNKIAHANAMFVKFFSTRLNYFIIFFWSHNNNENWNNSLNLYDTLIKLIYSAKKTPTGILYWNWVSLGIVHHHNHNHTYLMRVRVCMSK